MSSTPQSHPHTQPIKRLIKWKRHKNNSQCQNLDPNTATARMFNESPLSPRLKEQT